MRTVVSPTPGSISSFLMLQGNGPSNVCFSCIETDLYERVATSYKRLTCIVWAGYFLPSYDHPRLVTGRPT
jgi:hypothetical protein